MTEHDWDYHGPDGDQNVEDYRIVDTHPDGTRETTAICPTCSCVLHI